MFITASGKEILQSGLIISNTQAFCQTNPVFVGHGAVTQDAISQLLPGLWNSRRPVDIICVL
jgi:hypothetical protein